jgi:hypothetical protein
VNEDDSTRLTYQGTRFPKWLVILWLLLFAWIVFYMLRYAAPNFSLWLEKKPIDRFVQ